MYTMYVIWFIIMLELWQKSLKSSRLQVFFASCIFWYFAEDIPQLVCLEFYF